MHDAPNAAGTRTEDSAQRLLATLERLLAIQATDLTDALTQASQVIVAAMGADKVDVFLHDPTSAALVALGVSDTPMGRHEEDIGLDRLPLARGGRTVEVFQSGTPYLTGHADADPHIDVGFRRDLGVRSMLIVPLEIAGVRRGVVAVDAARPDAFAAADLPFFGAVAHWVGVLAHRSELQERVTREAAAQARRVAAEDLIRVLAHDLRAPLTPLRGHLNLLRRRAQQDDRSEDLRHVAEAEAGVLRLNVMISDLLDAGRLDQGLFSVEPQPINLATLARETAATLRSPEAEIDVRAPDDLTIQADPQRVRQALENLLANALRHTPPGVPVTLEVARETRDGKTWAVLTVQDAGPGIPPDLLPTIFERFAAGPGSPGLGLGLYLARGIAEAHGGTLTVESAPGQGTTCRFALPLTAGQAAGAASAPRRRDSHQRRQRAASAGVVYAYSWSCAVCAARGSSALAAPPPSARSVAVVQRATAWERASRSNGLGRCASTGSRAALAARSRSAESTMMGIGCVRGSARRRWLISAPSICGMRRSSRITSGRRSWAMRSAGAPSAVSTR